MVTTLTADRVRSDLEVVSRAGLDLDEFVDEALASLRRAVPFAGACAGTIDPMTLLLTGSRKFGQLAGVDPRDHEFGLQEYGRPEPTSFTELAAAAEPAGAVHESTRGRTSDSPRLTNFISPFYGFGDELRVVLREGGGPRVWGGFALFRAPDDAPFAREEVEFAASVSSTLAAGVRVGLLTRFATATGAAARDDGRDDAHQAPAVLVFDAADRLSFATPGAHDRLAEIDAYERPADHSADIVGSLVAAARRFLRGEVETPPRARVRARDGRWFVLHASPMDAAGGLTGPDTASSPVVVTIEGARPPDIVPLVVAAFGLTPRERDVTALVLQGADTKTIAQTLHLSAYTVQDHLKTIFDKANVRSRRELIARVYVDQYAPRPRAEVRPDGSLVA